MSGIDRAEPATRRPAGRRAPVAALVVLASLAGGCLPGRFGRDDLASYFPMETHRQWQYRLSDLQRDQRWPVAVTSRGPRFVPKLGRVVVIFDEEYPDQVMPVAFFLSEGFLQSEIGLDYGVAQEMRILPIGIQPMRVMPMPPTVGRRWSYSEEVFHGGEPPDPGFVIHWSGGIHAEAAVAVPAGDFRNCLRVESIAVHRTSNGDEVRQYRYLDWYAPGVGLVKSEYAWGSPPLTLTRMELTDFEPGPRLPVLGPGEFRMASPLQSVRPDA